MLHRYYVFLSSGQDDVFSNSNYCELYWHIFRVYIDLWPNNYPTTSHHQFVVIRNVMSANPIKAVKRATVPVYKLIYVDSIQKRYSS